RRMTIIFPGGRRSRAAVRVGLPVVCALLLAACSIPGSRSGGHPSSARRSSPTAGSAPAHATSGTVWILPALGLQVHARPSLSARRVYTLACGAKVSTVEQTHAGGHDWLHVRSGSGGVNGWIVDSPQYEIDRSMTSYTLGGTMTMLYPTTWSVQSGNPAIFTAPAGDPAGGTLHVQSAAQATSLPNLPMSAGTEDTAKESTISLDGIPTQVFVYLSNGGGTEYFVERKLGTLAYLIDLQQPQSTPDTVFFLQLLASVNAQFPNPSPSPSPSASPSPSPSPGR
ncbi:MAG: SH3 domain-containing protein, partial [Candidatus Dormibacteraeota bacterium]|nr:SH3 domain-containing protein [Candidatus Dormibacteraeota bacterium]